MFLNKIRPVVTLVHLSNTIELFPGNPGGIVVTFLYHLSQLKRYKKAIDRSLRRIIIKAYKELPEIQQEIDRKIEEIIISNNI